MATLTRDQVTGYAAKAGFTGNGLAIIVAIAQAESSLNTLAIGRNTGSTDRGLYQINNVYHPEISDACAYDPACSSAAAFRISSNGTNFTPWSTYNSGAYKQYLTSTKATQPAVKVKSATSNTYPKGQCTWWASERYHQLTGYYVPWIGNANQWVDGARQFKWNTSAVPPKSIPSIIVLSGGAQGSDGLYGHVAVVEKVNSDGTVYTSNQNWNYTSSTTYVTFKTGPGVSFVWANDNSGSVGPSSTGGNGSGSGSGASYVPLLDQVHQTLIDLPGFYGIALALDEAEQFPGYVDLADPSIQAFGVNFDVVGWMRSLGATTTDNMLPLAIRSTLVFLGLLIIIALILKIVLVAGTDVAKVVAPIAKAVL